MRTARRLAIALAATLSAVLSACSPPAEPEKPLEVNDANCRLEFLSTLPKEQREDLAGRCFRRGTFKPSPHKTW